MKAICWQKSIKSPFFEQRAQLLVWNKVKNKSNLIDVFFLDLTTNDSF